MLTHVDQNHQPTMVDVSDKKITTRIAVSESCITLPEAIRPFIQSGEIHLKKGAVFQTAIIAGTMAAKKTHEIIPFCHSIALESCKFEISLSDDLVVKIRCRVKTESKTGVEMEALHGTSVAALTIYDMCKAVSHQMVIGSTRLISKSGGKKTVFDRPLYGLILTGGKSSRMKSDKALLEYAGKAQAERVFDLLSPFCEKVFLSARPNQWQGTVLNKYSIIEDQMEGIGPSAGIIAALNTHPDAYWLVMACDLPRVTSETIQTLVNQFNPDATATCFLSEDEEYPEALCAIYTPLAKEIFEASLREDVRCPVKILKKSKGHFLKPSQQADLSNINTPEEYREVLHELT